MKNRPKFAYDNFRSVVTGLGKIRAQFHRAAKHKNLLARNFFLDKNAYPEYHVEIRLVILLLIKANISCSANFCA